MAGLDKNILKFMRRLEKILVRLAVFGCMTLIVLQLALVRVKDPVEFYLAFAQKIDSPPLQQIDVNWQPNLVLMVEGADTANLKVLLNDKVAGTFTDGRLELSVSPGDRLALDARQSPGQVKLKVAGVSENLSYPRLNQQWRLQGSILDLGTVHPVSGLK